MKVYNTLTRKKEEFLPLGSKVRMFVCGPTVYDYSHIGHARTYIAYDVIARYLRHRGYDVFYLQNITDIEDKIIERARQKMINPSDLAQEYKEAYYKDMKRLGIDSVSEYASATQYIPEIISQVKRLLEKSIAYLIEDEGYYFDLTKFPDYGQLSGRTVEAAEDAVSRIDESAKKKNKGDFALWKFSKPEEPGWDSELGYGRPGWHIEDTAITEKYFGTQYDFHGGSRDLIFPHHEAEIAQMESLSGKKPFVKYWVHSGFLTINGQKMSKSLGNFITIRDLLNDYRPQDIRFMVLSSHYRSPIDYSDDKIKAAAAAVDRLGVFIYQAARLVKGGQETSEADWTNEIEGARKSFYEKMDDDFNFPEAIGHIFDLIRKINPDLYDKKLNHKSAEQIVDLMEGISGFTGIILPEMTTQPLEIQGLIRSREDARQIKDFAHADKLRQQIKKLGYEVDDTAYGPLVKKQSH